METRTGLLNFAEVQRQKAMADVNLKTQSQLGQFFTPSAVAEFIVSMLEIPAKKIYRVLDPGAGSGILSVALVDRIFQENPNATVELVAVERDSSMIPYLEKSLENLRAESSERFKYSIIQADFILDSIGLYATLNLESKFDLVVQNPPYGKLSASSEHRKAMRELGVDVPNLYAAFLILANMALKKGGRMVAITPRSFCNGPYFGSFRKKFLDAVSLKRIHVFKSRNSVFSDTGVLQENVVFAVEKGADKKDVILSTSLDHLTEISFSSVPYEKVVYPEDAHQFIRLSTSSDDIKYAEKMMSQPCALKDLGIQVSTGKIVDFRNRDALTSDYQEFSFPVVYPGNFYNGLVKWPLDIKKPQFFSPQNTQQEKMLMPAGWYVLVKRFSSKEEKRRVTAAVWSPDNFAGSVGFENHINFFHNQGQGLDKYLAFGIAEWLNSGIVDGFFRTFSGHTQVNATDLKSLRFPTFEELREVGKESTSYVTSFSASELEESAA